MEACSESPSSKPKEATDAIVVTNEEGAVFDVQVDLQINYITLYLVPCVYNHNTCFCNFMLFYITPNVK